MLIFASEIALRVQRSDLAQNPNVPAYFLSARLQCSRLLRNCGNINPLFRRGRGERRIATAQTIGLNCGRTQCPGKIEYNCRYFIMSFRTQIHKKKSVKMVFIHYRVLCPTAHWQCLKFKNHCSLLPTSKVLRTK